MDHIVFAEKADKLMAGSSDLPEYGEFGFDEEGNPLRYVKFSAGKLKELRKEKQIDMTQAELASALGVSRPLITQYESGLLTKPTYELLCDLGRVFSERAGYKIVLYADWEENNEKTPDSSSGE